MNSRILNILNMLILAIKPLTIEELANKCSVSERTIYYDVSKIRKELKKHNIELFNQRNKGYYVLNSDKSEILKVILENSSNKKIDLSIYIDIYLLALHNNMKIDYQELSKKLYYDPSSIRRMIEKPTIIKFNKILNISNISYELQFRLSFVELVYLRIEKYLSEGIISAFISGFPLLKEELNLNFLQGAADLISSEMNKYNLWLDDESFIKLVTYLYISFFRKKDDVSNDLGNIDVVNEALKDLTNEIGFSKTLLGYNLLNSNSKDELIMLIQTILIYNIHSFDSDFEDANIKTAIKSMIDQIVRNTDLDVNKTNLFSDLLPHLTYVVKKSQLGLPINKNPLFDDIRIQYKKYYDLGKIAYKNFCRNLNIGFSESEASYIAIYLYKNINKKINKKFYVYLVCPIGKGLSEFLHRRIEETFLNIEVKKIFSSVGAIKSKELTCIDFIISTVDIDKTNVNSIVVSPLLTQQDINKILRYIEGKDYVDTPFRKKYYDEQNTNLEKYYIDIMVNIIFMLYEVEEVINIKKDNLFGLLTHSLISIYGIIHNENSNDNNAMLSESLSEYTENYPQLTGIINKYISKIERDLDIVFPKEEIYAIYYYLIP
ncbi:BglG family transcription antiterminator [Aerococcus urinae]|uniref:BglG family transcription antiterminator n=1 Tax=Aerococcus urinae TaxID=1376 RepID=UPI00255086F0|nr:PRD domain-containing protein [Aerococcus urinae]MDK6375285.1 PRD domain-containing protein [Aerococcus urinae]MDK6420133.1 PRD domain-containing protein [Aerococcus urinae]MDK8075626.1 PRD domain-containing protein [Aerococcus urinae]MDK8084605.1 PRD domain-containing protein [Aerococcus urinae]